MVGFRVLTMDRSRQQPIGPAVVTVRQALAARKPKGFAIRGRSLGLPPCPSKCSGASAGMGWPV